MRMVLMDSMMNFYLSDDYRLPMLEVNSLNNIKKESHKDDE